jgi:hypothetical protein
MTTVRLQNSLSHSPFWDASPMKSVYGSRILGHYPHKPRRYRKAGCLCVTAERLKEELED